MFYFLFVYVFVRILFKNFKENEGYVEDASTTIYWEANMISRMHIFFDDMKSKQERKAFRHSHFSPH